MNNLDLTKMEEALDSSIKQKNTLTQHEFQHFEPLFRGGADSSTLERLGDEWAMRVSLYDEVRIVDDNGKVINKLSPALQHVNSLNTIDPNGALVNALVHELTIDNPIHSQLKQVGDIFVQGIKKVNNIEDSDTDNNNSNLIDSSKVDWD